MQYTTRYAIIPNMKVKLDLEKRVENLADKFKDGLIDLMNNGGGHIYIEGKVSPDGFIRFLELQIKKVDKF